MKPHIPPYTYFVYPISPIRTSISHEYPLELGWTQRRKKEGHCDITAHTVLLYVLFCLTYMYCTLYHRHRYIVPTIHVPCFLVLIYLHFVITCSDLTHTYISSHTSVHLVSFTTVNKHRPYSLSSRCTP